MSGDVPSDGTTAQKSSDGASEESVDTPAQAAKKAGTTAREKEVAEHRAKDGTERNAREEAERAAGQRAKKGRELYDKGEYAAALTEFHAARRLFPLPMALTGSGVCLLKLQRYDEALDAFEAALSQHGDELSAPAKKRAQQQVVQMRKTTGTVAVTGAEVGAIVVVDGRLRGEYPLPGPLNVLVGERVVRVYKEGFARFEKSVQVTQGQSTPFLVKLEPLTRSGRLRVEERTGMALDVVVDGVPVGVTPWEGALPVGEHTILLRSQDNHGTLPSSATVLLNETTRVFLEAEQLGASIKVTPVPATASVLLDGFFVGRGVFEGRLHAGDHSIRVVASGYFPERQKFSVEAGGEKTLSVPLKKDPNDPMWKPPGHFTIELRGGVPFAHSFGGDIASPSRCTGGCTYGWSAGGLGALSGGYERSDGFSFGITAGYLAMQQTTKGRPTLLKPEGIPVRELSNGTAKDTVSLQSFVAAVYGAYKLDKLGGRFPLRIRLSMGVALGRIADVRTGVFQPTDPTIKDQQYDVGPLTQSGVSTWFFFSPEVRLGRRIGGNLEVSLGLSALFLAGNAFRWDEKVSVHAAADGAGRFPDDAVSGPLLYAITPDLGIRYDF